MLKRSVSYTVNDMVKEFRFREAQRRIRRFYKEDLQRYFAENGYTLKVTNPVMTRVVEGFYR